MKRYAVVEAEGQDCEVRLFWRYKKALDYVKQRVHEAFEGFPEDEALLDKVDATKTFEELNKLVDFAWGENDSQILWFVEVK